MRSIVSEPNSDSSLVKVPSLSAGALNQSNNTKTLASKDILKKIERI